MEITEAMYEFALARIEELLPITPDCAPEENRNAAELDIVSSIVEEYETIHYPIGTDVNEKPNLMEITKPLYDLAQTRIKELLSISTDCVPEHNFPKAELDIMHNIIEKYETKRTRI